MCLGWCGHVGIVLSCLPPWDWDLFTHYLHIQTDICLATLSPAPFILTQPHSCTVTTRLPETSQPPQLVLSDRKGQWLYLELPLDIPTPISPPISPATLSRNLIFMCFYYRLDGRFPSLLKGERLGHNQHCSLWVWNLSNQADTWMSSKTVWPKKKKVQFPWLNFQIGLTCGVLTRRDQPFSNNFFCCLMRCQTRVSRSFFPLNAAGAKPCFPFLDNLDQILI